MWRVAGLKSAVRQQQTLALAGKGDIRVRLPSKRTSSDGAQRLNLEVQPGVSSGSRLLGNVRSS